MVAVGRAVSRMEAVERGVPQGSVLGPLLYSLYTNEMPMAVKDPACQDPTHEDRTKLFGGDCRSCGAIIQYADDATFHVSNKHRDQNQQKLTRNLENLRCFLNSNKMTINMDKTHLLETMIKQRKCKTPGSPPTLDTVDKDNQPYNNC